MAEEKKDAATEGEEKKDVVVPEKFKSLVESVEKLTALELSELVTILEDKFGVSAAAPMMMAGVAPAADGGDAGAEEQTSFNVELSEVGESKISVIKVVRTITEKGLKEAKDLVDGAPQMIKEGVSKEEAEKIKKEIEEAGGKVNLK